MENLVAPAPKLFGNEIVRRRNGSAESGGDEVAARKSRGRENQSSYCN